jgi:antirestriction protein ArdC
MLCSVAGINTSDTFNNSASYISGWLSRLKDDKKLIVQTSNEAQKAVILFLVKVLKGRYILPFFDFTNIKRKLFFINEYYY